VAIKLKLPKSKSSAKGTRALLPRDPVLRAALVIFVTLSLLVIGTFSYFYVKYDRIIERRFSGQVFSSAARIYAQPETLRVGEKIDAKEIAAQLKRAGYTEGGSSPIGTFRMQRDGIEINPGPESYHRPDSARVRMPNGKIEGISGKSGDLDAYELEPELVTSLFDAGQRAKRQIVRYQDIPKVLVDAVTSIEDRRFFQHSGVNFVRLAEAVWVDLTHQRHEQGGSTLTMQLSRGFFLTPEKTVKRKAIEILIAVELERKFSKQQIFEFYTNWVDLGQRGSFTISGFAEAARA
jgi:penicillin-binding protein 1B